MRITVAKSAGFCFGVKRAVEECFHQIENAAGPVYTFGPIIHNDQVVDELNRKGVQVIRSEEELEQVKKQIEKAKTIQPLVLDGDFYRLRSPYETNECIWELVSRDKSQAFVMCSRIMAVIRRNRHYDPKIRLKGLDENAVYRDIVHDVEYSGALLMNRGITIDYPVEDFATYGMLLKRV